MKRVLTALALIPIVGWVVLFANSWIFLAVLVTVACLCYREYNDIAAAYGFGAPGVVGGEYDVSIGSNCPKEYS